MFQLKKGPNKVELSLTPSFTPLLEFNEPHTGKIYISKQQPEAPEKKEATINAKEDEILDLSSYREYFTAYRDNYSVLVITVDAEAVLNYEPIGDIPAESVNGKTLEFTVRQDPDYKPPPPETQKCPMCPEQVPVSDLMTHIQSAHM